MYIAMVLKSFLDILQDENELTAAFSKYDKIQNINNAKINENLRHPEKK